MIYYIGSIPCAPSDIQHWGIKGQKWGVRRFRNPDGSLTDAGKARYAASTGKKNPLDMTDKELQAAVNRLRNEKDWRALVAELDGKKISKGKKKVGEFLNTLGNQIVLPFAKSASSAAGKAIVDVMKEETISQNKEEREKEKKKNADAEERKRKRAAEEARWNEDRIDY